MHTLACCDLDVEQASLEHAHLEVIAKVRAIYKEIEVWYSQLVKSERPDTITKKV